MKKTVVLHPFLLGVYPIVTLFSSNLKVFPLRFIEVVAPIIIISAFSLISYILLSAALKNKFKAGMIVSLFLILFFSYGHILRAIWQWSSDTIKVDLIILGLLCLILFSFFIVKSKRAFRDFTIVLNIFSAVAVCTNLFPVGRYLLSHKAPLKGIEIQKAGGASVYPDIYYIVLDGYARNDVLKSLYHYDNSGFVKRLKDQGFYVASDSYANYCQTTLSLASSMNMRLLDPVAEVMGGDSINRGPLVDMITHSQIRSLLRERGYGFAAFSSGYFGTEIQNADIYMKPKGSLSEFQNILLSTTPVPLVLGLKKMKSQFDVHRERVLYILDNLGTFKKPDGPIFLFAHIPAPHPPFVLGPNGEKERPTGYYSVDDGSHYHRFQREEVERYIDSYNKQLVFITKKIEIAIAAIIRNPKRTSIIIMQSDHGPGSALDWENPYRTNLKERLAILNTIYFPDGRYDSLYDGMTPVNTFRIILNQYFNNSLELEKDKSYFSTWSHPYKFIEYDVTHDSLVAPQPIGRK